MDKTFVSLILIFFFSFTIFATIIIFDKPLGRFIRAKEELQASTKDSLVIAWPLQLKADGKSESTISVFTRNQNNKPVNNKIVNISSSLGTVKEQEVLTDKEGLATFHLLSDTSGTAEITVMIDKTNQISQKISIKFE